jgi:hypothetical protein
MSNPRIDRQVIESILIIILGSMLLILLSPFILGILGVIIYVLWVLPIYGIIHAITNQEWVGVILIALVCSPTFISIIYGLIKIEQHIRHKYVQHPIN